MEEKANFSYEGHVKLSDFIQPLAVDDANYTVNQMSYLTPMAVQWARDGEVGEVVVFIDFYTETIYNTHFDKLDTNVGLGKAMYEVLQQKKSEAESPRLPEELIEQVANTRKRISEGGVPNAREVQI